MLPGLYKVIGIALAAGSLLSGCAATPVPNVSLSNAERMQRGLPLKAPIKRFDPSRPRRESRCSPFRREAELTDMQREMGRRLRVRGVASRRACSA